LKLLIVSQYFWPEGFGINALAKALAEQGVEVTVLTGKPNYPDGQIFSGYSAWGVQREQFGDLEVIRLPLYPRGKKSSIRLILNYLSFISAGILLGPWELRQRRFDAIFVYAPSPLLQALPAVWLARLKRTPLAVWVQDLWPESLSATGFIKSKLVLRLVESVVRYIYRHSDRVMISSEGFRAPIERLVERPDRIYYYPNAYVEDQREVPVLFDAARALSEEIAGNFSIVFAGNLGTAQSLETIIGAAEILQQENAPIRIYLIGSGSMSDWLHGEVKRRGLRNVALPGRFPPESMAGFYSAAAALLVSLRNEPIFSFTIPSKVQGYFAAGRPVLASINGAGAQVVIEAKAGLACPAEDSDALASAALELLRLGEDARREMGENGRRYAAEHFALDRLATDLIAQLTDLAAGYREKDR